MTTDTMDLLDVLLMRVLDGEASPDERSKLLTLADAEPRLAEMEDLRSRLRVALAERTGEAPEVVAEVMAALTLDDGWDETAALLRQELGHEPIDLADGVMDALEVGQQAAVRISALHDGELGVEERLEIAGHLSKRSIEDMTDWADMGRLLRESLQKESQAVDLTRTWQAVAPRIGVEDPEEVPGWEPLADALRLAVHEAAALSAQDEVNMTAAVMNALPRHETVEEELGDEVSAPEPQPAWIRWASSPGMVFALAMALFLAVFYGPDGTDEAVDAPAPDEAVALLEVEEIDFVIGTDNQAEVEDLETTGEVTASVFQGEEGAPMFLMIDEGDDPEATL